MAAAVLLIGPLGCALVYKTVIYDCTFGRGLLIWFNQLLVVALLCGVVGGIGYGLNQLQKNAARR